MIVGLLTDFGTVDTYVGVMKGVILSIAPNAQIVDITHAVQPQNVQQGAFLLMSAFRYFPPGTVFVVVVDPGVGSSRRAVAVQAGGYTFVAPDNGVLSYALAAFSEWQAYELTNPVYQLAKVSTSFHGRDIFAPAAAHIVVGTALPELGAEAHDLVTLKTPRLDVQTETVVGEVLHVDTYGNVVTSIGALNWDGSDMLELRPRFMDGSRTLSFKAGTASVVRGNAMIRGIHRSFSDVPRGALLAMVGSSGQLELAVNHGNAAEQLQLMLGDEIRLQIG